MKTTKQKEAILAAVCTMRNHPTADDIYRKLRLGYPRISLGTVYRNLNIFAQRGDILKINVPEAGDRFDFRLERHEHLLCRQCGQVFDAEAEVAIKPKETDDLIDGYTLILHGLCAKCNQ